LLDEGTTFARSDDVGAFLARSGGRFTERRSPASHPVYQKPNCWADAPIGLVFGHHQADGTGEVVPTSYLYVILDIFSRRVVGWRMSTPKAPAQFKELFIDAMEKACLAATRSAGHCMLTGGPMKAKDNGLMLVDLCAQKSHSRPHTSNDKPVSSESHFKDAEISSLNFQRSLETIEQARDFCRRFVCMVQRRTSSRRLSG